MATKASDKLKEVIERVTASVDNINQSKIQTARDLAWAKQVIVWKLTEYKSWVKFCRIHVTLHPTTIHRYTTLIVKLEKLGYTNDEINTMLLALGWTRFVNGIFDTSRKLTVKGFIQKYKDWKTNAGATGDAPNGDRAYSFSLPVEEADKLDGYLTMFGMTTQGTRRHGVRDAFIELVRTQLD